MLLPVNSNLRRGAGRAPNAAPRTRSGRGLIAVLLFAACLFSGCAGYLPAADMPSVIGDGSKTLLIKEVDYPTLQPWLPYLIRNTLRDEVNARRLAQWVDSAPADYEISIKVNAYTTYEWMSDKIDRGILYDTTLTITAVVFEGNTNKEIWRSDPLSYSDRLELLNEQVAAEDLVKQLIRRLADAMRNTF